MRSLSPVLWRQPGESQIGADPGLATILTGLSEAEQRLVDKLRDEVSPHEFEAAGRALGVQPDRMRELMARLRESGALVDVPADPEIEHAGWSTDLRHWQLEGAREPERMLRSRSERVVAVLGLCRVGRTCATDLAAAGVGTILLTDERPLTPDDVGAGPLPARDLGTSRQGTTAAWLRSQYPGLRTSAPAGTRPDLVIVTTQDVPDLRRLRPLLREDIPHLLLTTRERDVVVGPLVRPGSDACAQCLALHHVDADEHWPAVATHLLHALPRHTETLLAIHAAAVAATQALAQLDGRPVRLAGASVRVASDGALSDPHHWQTHPRCGCTGPAAPTTREASEAADVSRRQRAADGHVPSRCAAREPAG